ncbi:MAG: alpha/beta fold hydrolase [Capsulimonadales bacterium]|nr:alpha/beta fold hydrolase [Capsulimonadales bacterium]
MSAFSLLGFKTDRPQPERHVFPSGRHKIVYETVGDGPALILIHGLSGSGRWWKHNLSTLSAHFTCYIIELVGYGSNRAFRPLPLRSAAEALALFIGTQTPTGRAHVIGHSMGGQIASVLAATYPDRVERLVLAAASGLLKSDIVRMALRLPIAGHYSPLDFLPTLVGDALRAGPVNLLLSTLDILGSDTTEMLRTVAAPTLLVFGDRDNLVPVTVGEAMDRLIPDSRLEVIEGAGHVLMWDHPRTFNRLVLDFLLPPPPGPPDEPRDEQRPGDRRYNGLPTEMHGGGE